MVLAESGHQNSVNTVHGESGAEKKIRRGDADTVDHEGGGEGEGGKVVLVILQSVGDQEGVVGKEGVEERGGEVVEIEEGAAVVGDDVVAESADVGGGVGDQVEGVEEGVLRGEDGEGGGGGRKELEFEIGSGDGVGEETRAMASQGIHHAFNFFLGITAHAGDDKHYKEEEEQR